MTSNLPTSWLRTTIEELYSVIGGGTPSTGEPKYWNGEIPWITSADISDNGEITPRKNVTRDGVDNSTTNLVPSDSLIVVTRVGLGKVALSEYPLCFSQDSQALVGSADFVYPKYAFYYLLQAVKVFKYQNRGTTISGVTKKQLKDLQFLLPPYSEQHRIVAKIEELFTKLDAGVEALKHAQAQLKRYRQSVLKAAVEGKLTAVWREQHKDELEPADKLLEHILKKRREKWEAEQLATYKDQGKTPPKNWQNRYKEPIPPDTKDLPELPKGWTWTTTAAISSKITDGVHKKPNYVLSGVPFVTVKNLTAGPGISFDDLKYITKNDHKKFCQRTKPERGDILISKDGTLGVVRLVNTDREFNIFVSVILMKPIDNDFSNYLEIALSSPQIQKQMIPKGTGLQHIHLEDFRADCIPISSKGEQLEIEKKVNQLLSIIVQSEKLVESELKRAQSLRQSILKCAFEGRLVPQDPNDEPASLLLDRIRAEKAKNKTSKHLEMF